MGEVIRLTQPRPTILSDHEAALEAAFEEFRRAWDEAERRPNIHTYRAAVATYDRYKQLADDEVSA